LSAKALKIFLKRIFSNWGWDNMVSARARDDRLFVSSRTSSWT